MKNLLRSFKTVNLTVLFLVVGAAFSEEFVRRFFDHLTVAVGDGAITGAAAGAAAAVAAVGTGKVAGTLALGVIIKGHKPDPEVEGPGQ